MAADDRQFLIGTGAVPQSLGLGVGLFEPKFDDQGNGIMIGGTLTIENNPSDFVRATKKAGFAVDAVVAAGHEFGHAVGTINNQATGLRGPASLCLEPCANKFMNRVRADRRKP